MGYEIVLVNSKPSMITTDPGLADAAYIEPSPSRYPPKSSLSSKRDAVPPNLGGQSALNPAADLLRQRLLEAYGIQVIGVNSEAIERGEDRTAV